MTRQLRLLYVIDSLVFGGAERSLAELAPRYIEQGIQLDVAYLHERSGLGPQLRDAGAGLFSLAGSGGRAGWIRRAHRLVSDRHPDLVHTSLFEADLAGRVAARLNRIPAVSSFVNEAYGPDQLGDPRLSSWKIRGAQLVDGLTARWVVRFHAVTGRVADLMARRLRIPRDKIEVIPRGRDPAVLGVRTPHRRAAARAELGIGPKTPMLLAIGRQEYQKGFDLLIQALPLMLSRVPSLRLFIAGREGNASRSLGEAIDRLQLRSAVRLLGARNDIPELLCASDVFVLSSRWEGFPGVLLEAMALETPVVATAIPPVHEALGPMEHGILVEPGKAKRLAEAALATLEDPASARRRARASRTHFLENFTIDRVADRMINFYDRALRRVRGTD